MWCDDEHVWGHFLGCIVKFLYSDVVERASSKGWCVCEWWTSMPSWVFINIYILHFSSTVLSLFKIHIVVSFLGLLVYLCFSRKHGVEYVSGVSRPCYSCNIRYMQWIYSMCTVFPYPWTWLYTCVGMHMLNLPRGVLNVAQKMCDTQYIFSCCHFYKVWKNKSFGGYGLGDVRGWYDWLVRSRTVFYWDGQSFLLD